MMISTDCPKLTDRRRMSLLERGLARPQKGGRASMDTGYLPRLRQLGSTNRDPWPGEPTPPRQQACAHLEPPPETRWGASSIIKTRRYPAETRPSILSPELDRRDRSITAAQDQSAHQLPDHSLRCNPSKGSTHSPTWPSSDEARTFGRRAGRRTGSACL